MPQRFNAKPNVIPAIPAPTTSARSIAGIGFPWGICVTGPDF